MESPDLSPAVEEAFTLVKSALDLSKVEPDPKKSGFVVKASHFFSCTVRDKNGTLEIGWQASLLLSTIYTGMAILSPLTGCLPMLALILLIMGIHYGLTYRSYSALRTQIRAAIDAKEMPFGPGTESSSKPCTDRLLQRLPTTKVRRQGDKLIVKYGRYLTCGVRRTNGTCSFHYGGLSWPARAIGLVLVPTFLGLPAWIAWCIFNPQRNAFAAQVEAALGTGEIPDGPATETPRYLLTPITALASLFLLGVLPLFFMTLLFVGEVYETFENHQIVIDRYPEKIAWAEKNVNIYGAANKGLSKMLKRFEKKGKITKSWCKKKFKRKGAFTAKHCSFYACFTAEKDPFRRVPVFHKVYNEERRCSNFKGFRHCLKRRSGDTSSGLDTPWAPYLREKSDPDTDCISDSTNKHSWDCKDKPENVKAGPNSWGKKTRVSPVRFCPSSYAIENAASDSQRAHGRAQATIDRGEPGFIPYDFTYNLMLFLSVLWAFLLSLLLGGWLTKTAWTRWKARETHVWKKTLLQLALALLILYGPVGALLLINNLG